MRKRKIKRYFSCLILSVHCNILLLYKKNKNVCAVQIEEEKTEKQEALVEKEAKMEQLMAHINSLQTEISSLTEFQVFIFLVCP